MPSLPRGRARPCVRPFRPRVAAAAAESANSGAVSACPPPCQHVPEPYRRVRRRVRVYKRRIGVFRRRIGVCRRHISVFQRRVGTFRTRIRARRCRVSAHLCHVDVCRRRIRLEKSVSDWKSPCRAGKVRIGVCGSRAGAEKSEGLQAAEAWPGCQAMSAKTARCRASACRRSALKCSRRNFAHNARPRPSEVWAGRRG